MIAGLRKLLSLVGPALRRQWLLLLPLSALCAGLEAVGALIVYGLIRLIGSPEAEGPIVVSVPALWDADLRESTLAITAALALFYLAKNALLAFLAIRRNQVSSRSIAELSGRLFRAYLRAPYAVHLKRNSAELVRNATDSCEVAFESVAKALLVVATEALVIAGLVFVLFLAAPGVALFAPAILLAGLALVLRLTQRRLETWSRRTEEQKVEAIRNVQQSIGGLRELKVMGRGEFFSERFASLQNELASLRARGMNFVSAPPLLIETGFVCSTLVVIALLVGTGEGRGPGSPQMAADLLPLLGLYAYAGFRAIPSMHRISMNFNFARFGLAAVDNLQRDLVYFESRSPSPGVAAGVASEPFSFHEEISLENVSFRYEGSESLALDSIDLRIPRGQSLGVVGRTGSGKSTLVDLLLGLLAPTTGRVAVDQRDIQAALPAWQSRVGYVPQDVYLMDDSLLRNVAFGFRDDEIDVERAERALALAQLDGFVRSLPLGLQTMLGERGTRLSGGQVQRVAIARALYHEPELIVFDEATSSLDPRTEAEVTAAIENLYGVKTLIVVTHRIATVERCDRLILLEAGKLRGEGSYRELAAGNPGFRAILGEPGRRP